MASARWPGSGSATARRTNKWRTAIRTCGVYSLIFWVRRGAANVRVHVSVVERTCQNRHRGRADAAAVDGAFVIATLPSCDTANDQPDDKQHRSNVHLDLRLKKRILPSDRMAVTLVVIREEAYPYVSTTPFPEIWKSGHQRNSAELSQHRASDEACSTCRRQGLADASNNRAAQRDSRRGWPRPRLPCRAVVVPQDLELCGRDRSPPLKVARVVLAEAEPRAAGPARAGLL